MKKFADKVETKSSKLQAKMQLQITIQIFSVKNVELREGKMPNALYSLARCSSELV